MAQPMRDALWRLAELEEQAGRTTEAKESVERWRRAGGDGRVANEQIARLEATGAALIWASTTPVPKGAAGRIPGDEVMYNEIAAEVMAAHGIATDDLYAAMLPKLGVYQKPANVHFLDEGSAFLADHVSASIRAALKWSVP